MLTGIQSLTIALLVITWILVTLRLGVRLFMIRSLGWDDFFLLGAQATYCAIAVLDVTKGSQQIISREQLLSLLKFVLVAPLLYVIQNILLRVSLGLFFLRFLVQKWQRYFVYISISVYTAFALSYLITNAVFYGNTDALANKMLDGQCSGASCGHFNVIGPMSYTLAALNTFIDLTFAILPILFIRKANMPLKTKLSVCGLLGLGSISSIASIMRFPYIGDLNVTSGVVPADTFIIATTIEGAAGIAALAAAALRPLFALKLTRTLLSTRGNKEKAYGHGTQTAHSLATLNTVNVHATTEITADKASDDDIRGLGTLTTITGPNDPEKGQFNSSKGAFHYDEERLSNEFRF